MKRKLIKCFAIILSIIGLCVSLLSCTIKHYNKKHDKQIAIETCHGLMLEYIEQFMIYERYKEGNSAESVSIAKDAKNRANALACKYNDFYDQNSQLLTSDINAGEYVLPELMQIY